MSFKMLLISIVYLPIVIISYMVYGLFCGIVGTIIGTIELIQYQYRQKYLLWKRFPDFSRKVWEMQSASKNTQQMMATRKNFEKQEDPFFLTILLGYILIGLGLLPYRMIYGIVAGPIKGMVEAIDIWQERVLKLSFKDRIANKFF